VFGRRLFRHLIRRQLVDVPLVFCQLREIVEVASCTDGNWRLPLRGFARVRC